MFFRLGCLFVLLPIVELALLLRVGQWIGLWPTVALVAVTGLLGAVLARREGLRALTAVQLEVARGRVPARPLMDGAAVLVGGAFLLTPGVLTDVIGFALLLPPVRSLFYAWAKRRLARAISRGSVRMTVWGTTFGEPGGGPLRDEPGSRPGHRQMERDRNEQDDDDGDRPPERGEIIQ